MSHAPGSTLKALVKLGRRPDDCWQWLGKVSEATGQPQKQLNGQNMPARRWMWMQLFGPIPPGLVVTSTCGNKTCTNPHHLRACFQAEANRGAAGATLLPADVVEIRKAERTANNARHYADRYGVTVGTIRDVWARRSWTRARANNGPRAGVGA
jgi:hypothetical protein